MKCVKCGKKIPKGINKLCEDCQKQLIKDLKKEEKEEKKTKIKIDNGKFSKPEIVFMITCIIVIIGSISVSAYTLIKRQIALNKSTFSTTDEYLGKNIGNTIGNIRYYGFAAKEDDWIYYYTANEDFSTARICKIKTSGANKSIIFEESNMEIYSINAIGNYIYFTGIIDGEYSSSDSVDNKIYKMKNDGSDVEVINNNNFSNLNYYFYVINDKIYFIGTDENIYSMNLDGTDISLVSNNETGFLGVTEKYIIFDKIVQTGDNGEVGQVTYIMNLDGSNERVVIENKKLSHVNIENEYIYYLNDDQNIYRTKIDSGKEELVYEGKAYLLNVYNNYAYFFNYTNSDNTSVGIYRIDFLSEGFNSELVKTLNTTSYYMDVVGEYVNYLDKNDKFVSVNLLKTDGSLKNLQLFTYNIEDVQKYYGNNEEE